MGPGGEPSAHQSDGIVADLRLSMLSAFQDYGWFILLGGMVLYMAYSRIHSSLNSPSPSRTSNTNARNPNASREDPDKILDRQEKIAAARARMQVSETHEHMNTKHV